MEENEQRGRGRLPGRSRVEWGREGRGRCLKRAGDHRAGSAACRPHSLGHRVAVKQQPDVTEETRPWNELDVTPRPPLPSTDFMVCLSLHATWSPHLRPAGTRRASAGEGTEPSHQHPPCAWLLRAVCPVVHPTSASSLQVRVQCLMLQDVGGAPRGYISLG